MQGSYKSQFWSWLFAWQTTSHGFYLSTPMPIFKYLPTVCSLPLLIKSDLGNTFQNSPFCMFFKFCQISRKYKPIYCLKVKINQICIFYLFFSSCLCTCLNGYFLGKWILTSAVICIPWREKKWCFMWLIQVFTVWGLFHDPKHLESNKGLVILEEGNTLITQGR